MKWILDERILRLASAQIVVPIFGAIDLLKNMFIHLKKLSVVCANSFSWLAKKVVRNSLQTKFKKCIL